MVFFVRFDYYFNETHLLFSNWCTLLTMILSRWSVILESTDSALYFCKLSKNQREGGVYKLQKSLKCHHHSFNWQNTAIRQIVIPVFFKLQIIIHEIVLPVYKSPELRGTIFNALDIINKLLNYLWLFWNLSLNNFDINYLLIYL